MTTLLDILDTKVRATVRVAFQESNRLPTSLMFGCSLDNYWALVDDLRDERRLMSFVHLEDGRTGLTMSFFGCGGVIVVPEKTLSNADSFQPLV